MEQGGAGAAILLHFTGKTNPADRPERFVMVDLSPSRLTEIRKMVEGLQTAIKFEFLCHQDSHRNDSLLSTIPRDTPVINATGMGKDLPGSPITNAALFPTRAIAWDLNYRGELSFLAQARTQKDERQLMVEDGWHYFLHGWTQAIAPIFHLDIDSQQFDHLASLATTIRASP